MPFFTWPILAFCGFGGVLILYIVGSLVH
jgi:hypothetical protein